jgi:hypothetical protein
MAIRSVRWACAYGSRVNQAVNKLQLAANPPFAGKVQDESIPSDLNYKLNTRATELLFLKWFIDHLAPGGRTRGEVERIRYEKKQMMPGTDVAR